MTAPRALVLSGFFLACVSAGSSGFGESPAESIPPAEQAEAERRVDAEPSPLPFTAAGFVELASRELERGRTARAAELVHLAARLPIDDRALLRTFADIALRSGAIDEGQRAARRLLREKPTDVRHHALMADAYRARGNLKESLSAADRALEANDRSQEAHASKGTTLLAAGNHEHAAESFRRALALDPTHAPALRGWAELLLARPLPPLST